MKLTKLFWLLILPLVIALAACGGEESPSTGAEEGPGEPTGGQPTGGSTISGVVNFTGTAPELEPIFMDAEPVCQEKYPDGAFTETVIVNDNGTLQNVFLSVKEGLPDQEWAVSSDAALLDQTGCRYVAHVIGVQVGQDIVIRNSDGILHNIHPMPTNNRPFNIGQPVEMETTRQFSTSEIMIPVECDVHDWMLGYIGVVDHPFFAVTGSDGSFEISGLPAGDYVIEAWHELYGTQTLSVSVPEDGTEQIEFTYEGA